MRAKKRHYPWSRLSLVGDRFTVETTDERREVTRKALHTAAKQKGMRVSVRRDGLVLRVERVS